MESVVCIASGGLDSACYAAMLAQEHDIYMMTFAYGQRATREIDAARRFAKILGAKEHKLVDISFMKLVYGSTNALTDSRKKLSAEFEQSLVVPARNAIFISIAGAWALSIGASKVAYGAHLGDVMHYADCRPEFARAIEESLNLADEDNIREGARHRVEVMSPAVEGMDKQTLLKTGYKILGSKIFSTWSCYSNGVRKKNSRQRKMQGKVQGHGHGHGHWQQYVHCGRCESCINRKAAFMGAQINDRTRYAE